MTLKAIKFKLLLVILTAIAVAPAASAGGPADWGVHRIWGQKALDELPLVKGSFITVFWEDVNPSPGKFDFTLFEKELERFDRLGMRVTVAIRGKFKPDFLFKEVPYHPEQLSVGVHDPQGSLQYWHPTYEARYKELLQAFASYLKGSRYGSSVYSIRLNINALGTEHSGIPVDKRSESQWITPKGVTFVPFSDAEDRSYKRAVTQNFHDFFAADFLVLVRSVLLVGQDDNVAPVVMSAIEEGRMGLVHTSSVPEPANGSTARKYAVHLQYGRNGVTPIYAEPYSASDRGPQPPAQWNYWRILSDLHVGVSYIAVYGVDIQKYSDPEYKTAFDFANRYAGYQTNSSASAAPGGWVALREGGEYLTGDYTFLMARMSGDANTPVEGVGPTWQKNGAWARKVRAGGSMRFQLDSRLANSMRSGNAVVRVTYLNSRSPEFEIKTPGSSKTVQGGSTGTWKTTDLVVPAAEFAGSGGADITLRVKGDVTFHMVEVIRDGPVAASTETAPPKRPKMISVD